MTSNSSECDRYEEFYPDPNDHILDWIVRRLAYLMVWMNHILVL